MTARRRGLTWLGRVVAALIVVGLAAYLFAVGLDQADKLASAISLVVALIVLFLPLFRRRQEPAPEAAAPVAEPAPVGADRDDLRPARGTAYLEDVRQLKPSVLLDREPELAELAGFCADETSSYWRWVADAWSGKTALLAWFVLHPPADVDVVSFFITTRFNPHSNRDAFIEAVTEQLDALTGRRSTYQETPVRGRHFQARLAEAAEHSRQAGRRLVLVVDGLDEDRGVVIDGETYTIAALLPAEPVPGLKVIVAGRPHPPLPAEIGSSHPLRQPANVHALPTAPQARASETDARSELRRLLADALGRQVLGLLVTAGGGLAVGDLATVTQKPRDVVTQLLESSVGRTFIRRPVRWRRGQERYAYGLAHEELRRETLRSLDPAELDGHRRSLVSWCESVAAEGWPHTTPEYLLQGYLGMLIEAGDLARAVAVATDDVRRERMLAITGGDHAARIEIAELAQALQAIEPPDLGLLGRLALHRAYVDDRNSRLPASLPALWVRLGDDERADALARGIASDQDRMYAVGELTRALIRTDDEERLERVVRTGADPDQSLQILVAMVEDAVRAGDPERLDTLTVRAQQVVPLATDEYHVRRLMRALAAAGDDRTERVQHVLSDPYSSIYALFGRIAYAQQDDDGDTAERLLARAERIVGDLTGEQRLEAAEQLELLQSRRSAGGAWRRPAEQSSAADPLDAISRITVGPEYWDALQDAAPGLAQAGRVAQILQLIDQGRERFESGAEDSGTWFTRPAEQATRSVARRLGYDGYDDAADEVLRLLPAEAETDELMASLAREAAASGRLSRTAVLLDRISRPEARLAVLPDLARALQGTGDEAAAQRVVEEGCELAGRVAAGLSRDNHSAYGDIVRLGMACIDVDRPGLAVELAELVQRSAARAVEHPNIQGLEALAEVLASSGDADRAEALLPSIRTMTGDFIRSDVVVALQEAGNDEGAEAMARQITSDRLRLSTLCGIVEFRARHGGDAEVLAGELASPLSTSDRSRLSDDDVTYRTGAVVALAAGGDYGAAIELARGVADAGLRERIAYGLCLRAATAGDDAVTDELLTEVSDRGDRSRVMVARARNAAATGRQDEAAEWLAGAVAEAKAAGVGSRAFWVWANLLGSGLRGDHAADVLDRLWALADAESDDDERDREFGTLMTLYRRSGRLDDAHAAFGRIEVAFQRDFALREWAREAGAADDPALEAVIAELDDEEAQGRARGWLATAVAAGGDYRRAAALAGELARSHDPDLLVAIVKAAAAAGDVAFAEQFVERAVEMTRLVDSKVRLWCELARSVGSDHQHLVPGWLRRAERLAMTARSPRGQAVALEQIAEVAEPEYARRLVARAFVVGPWQAPLKQMARVDPESFAALADVVIDLVAPRS